MPITKRSSCTKYQLNKIKINSEKRKSINIRQILLVNRRIVEEFIQKYQSKTIRKYDNDGLLLRLSLKQSKRFK